MKILIFGATGMVGQGVVRECLAAPDVTRVVVVGRTAVELEHPKLEQIVHTDLANLEAIEGRLSEFDACFFCLGVSSSGMTEEAYTRLTYGLTMSVARTLSRLSPEMTFTYVSGSGTDGAGRGRTMWARVKGKTENDLAALRFAGVFSFRPGFIQALDGIRSKTRSYRLFYSFTRPLWPLLKIVFPDHVLTTAELGKAMLAAARLGAGRRVLEAKDIARLAGARDPRVEDRRALLLLACVFALVYAYFFQGGGWNQNSHLDTIRAIVERGTMEITPYAENTGDVGVIDGRTYSNKPPGLAFWGVPLYFVIHNVERAAGVPLDAPWTITANAHLLTFYTSGLPAVALVLLLYLYFRREGATPAQGLCLAGGFGAGSLLLPYSGIMMSHALSACLLFGAWYLLGGRRDVLAGSLAGAAVLTELLAAPSVAIFVAYFVAKRRFRSVPMFLIGPAVALGVLLSSPALHAIRSSSFATEGLLFGMLDWPQPIRLFWLTLHPFRGLFACCPIFFICLLSPRRFTAEAWTCAAVVSYFVLFNMSFNGWTGGWAVGPRYLIPALPFLYTFALPGFVRFPRASGLLMAVSAAAMLCVTAVEVTIPGPDTGPPPAMSPVAFAAGQLVRGNVSIWSESLTGPSRRDPSPHRVWASYNVGELLGLRNAFSVIPVEALLFAFTMVAARSLRTSAPT